MTERLKKIKYIIKESFCGKKKSQEVFADIILSEYAENVRKIWTPQNKHDIIQETDNSQYDVCSTAKSDRKE